MSSSPNSEAPFDAVIVGGGPAGLSAALWLARYGRRVRVYDSGRGRNAATWAVHGYPGVPDLPPADLRDRIREQARAAGAEVLDASVREVAGRKDEFRVRTDDGEALARRVLLAFGLNDRLPGIPGLAEAYGTTAFHCPDCDGPSMVGARVGVLGSGVAAARMALYLTHWAESVLLLTHGEDPSLRPEQRATLERRGVAIHTPEIVRIDGRAGRVSAARLADGSAPPIDGVFFDLGSAPACRLADELGCAGRADRLRVDSALETSIPGVHAAGDLTGHPHLAISAAADGVRAALAIHRSLLPEELLLPGP